MTDISVKYMGLHLQSPVIVSSSSLTGNLENIRQCEKSGAGAVVLKSIFEEQIRAESEFKVEGSSEMYYWFPEARDHVMGLSIEANMEHYLEFIAEVKKSVSIPVISSINCTTDVEWPRFASRIQEAGADALELNISIFPFRPDRPSDEIEKLYGDIVSAVKAQVSIPVSVKIGYYFTNLCSMAHRLKDAGIDGLVMFNRYFRPDIDINSLEVVSDNHLSSPEELGIALRWIALLAGNNYPVDLVASTGVHYHTGLVKMLLAGATAVEVCSALYAHGISHIQAMNEELVKWMEEHKFHSIEAFRGKALEHTTTLADFERIQFMKRDFSV